ncbi:glycosyltransferase [Providencia huaxiensis]|uniref:glycosyltransferase n=1 Tax=Providencia huaxiensis TaxID=2027290 RepID=UPI00332EA828
MNIQVIIPSFYPAVAYGGPIYSTLYVYNELSSYSDINISVSTTNANINKKLDVLPNTWISFNKNFRVKYYNETVINKFSCSLAVNIWKDIKIADIIHIQSIFSISTPISLFLTVIFKKKVIISPRGSLGNWCLQNGSRFKKTWLNFLIKPFISNSIFHATSTQEEKEILACFDKANVEIIPNGINFSDYQTYNKLNKIEFLSKFTDKNFNKVDKIIISMGRLHKKKGFDILINSFYYILDTYPHAKLLIAGSDEGEEENLLNIIKEKKLADSVFIVGNILGSEKIDFFANADVFALPSHNENFGNVFLESLASGTPILASKNTPWMSIELHDCGIWTENSIENTYLALLELLCKDRAIMRHNSKALASSYDWKNIAKQFKSLYQNQLR